MLLLFRFDSRYARLFHLTPHTSREVKLNQESVEKTNIPHKDANIFTKAFFKVTKNKSEFFSYR